MELNTATTGALAAAHQRFARAVLWLYIGATTVSITVLVAGLVADRRYDEERSEQRLLLETQARARYFAHHLRLLSEELHRLGLRSEVNLLDHNLDPERSLLALEHEDSAFFDLGVAVVDASGAVLWAQPRDFLGTTHSLGHTAWFGDIRVQPRVNIVAVDPEDKTAIVYVLSPIVRGGVFTGALVGGVDLASGRPIESRDAPHIGQTVLATSRGSVIYPARPPAYAGSTEWKSLFPRTPLAEPIKETMLSSRPTVVAMAPLGLAGFTLLTVAGRAALFEPAWLRLRTRLLVGFVLAVSPLIGLLYLFRRSLLAFRRSEEAAVREDRLRRLGEASNLIAHEVRNSLNGLRVGFDLVLDPKHGKDARHERVVNELRAEIERLSSFTHQLMLFAKDPAPRPAPADLSEIVSNALHLTRDLADELGVRVEVCGNDTRDPVEVDATLVRIAISNLIANSLDALSTMQSPAEPPCLTVAVERDGDVRRVRVRDNGPGISAEVSRTLFEPFVTSKPSGVGIGLALARKVARAHGGDLQLERTPRGASFVLTLKAAATAATTAGAR